MPTAREVAEGLVDICTAVPPRGQGVCDCCHGRPGPGFAVCESCNLIDGQVSRPCDLVVPISLYRTGTQLHHVLSHYKRATDPAVRDAFTTQVAALTGDFIRTHGDCIRQAGGDWDVITTVPSSQPRADEHPLARAVKLVSRLRELYRPLLTRGTGQLSHRQASDQGFALEQPLNGERVLLIDDTFTSGARSQSAASAINIAGGTVVAIIAVGRVIDPAFRDDVQEFWDQQRAQGFSLDRCCLE